MSVQVRKKSSSVAHSGGLNNKAAHCDNKSYDYKLCSSKSVHAFRQTIPSSSSSKHKNHNNNRPQRQLLQPSSMQRYGSTNKKYSDNNASKNNIHTNSNNNKSSLLNTGQCYKQAIQKRKKKSLSISSNNLYKNKFNQQLLSTIDSFQQTLCSLPLDKLILSENPFYWVEQQIKTLQNLREKFFRVQRSLRQDSRGYYVSKLENVTRVLINIKDNLQTLTKMSLLKNYNSGGMSLDSRNSHSERSLHMRNNAVDQGNLNNLKVVELSLNNLQTSPHFSIQSSSNENKQNQMNRANKIRSNFSKVKMVKSQLKGQQISQQQQLVLKDYHHPSDYTSQSEDARMIINCRTQKSFKSISQSQTSDHQYYYRGDNDNNNKFNCNRKSSIIQHQEQQQNGCNNNNNNQDRQLSTMVMRRNQHAQPQLSMNKTVQKYHFTKSNDNKHLCQSGDRMDNYQQESKQTFNTLQHNNEYTLHQESVNTMGQETKRIGCNLISTQLTSQHNYSIQPVQQLKKLRQQLTIKTDILLKLQQKHVKQLKSLQVQFGRKEKHYLGTIYELKTQNQQKEHSIKQLLIEKQEHSEQLQLALKHLKSSIQSKKQHSGKQSLLQSSIETLTNQINKFKIRQDELRETVQLERQRTKKVLKDMQQLQEQLQTINNSLRQKQLNLQQSKTQYLELQNKLQQFMLQTQKLKSKQDIYKMKYFKLYADFDQFKQKVNDNQHYWSKICLYCKKDFIKADKIGDSEKGIELRQLINFHKRLLSQQL